MNSLRTPLPQSPESQQRVTLRNTFALKGFRKEHNKMCLQSSRAHLALITRHHLPREKRVSLTSSNVRVFLKLSLKSIIFLTAFFVLYCFLSANHQKLLTRFQRMKKVHDELETVLTGANDAGFADEKLVENVISNSNAPELVNAIDRLSPNSTFEISEERVSAAIHSRYRTRTIGLDNAKDTKSASTLHWNSEAKLNESTSEQFFGLGYRQEHIAMYSPLCLDVHSQEGISFEGETSCEGFSRTSAWAALHCSVVKSRAQKELLLRVRPDRKSKEWLLQNSKSIEWVTGLTVVQVLDRSCGNIAHFSGRVLFLQHILENSGSYATPPSKIANILILPDYHVMKRFLHPERYVHWHQTLMRSIVAPANLEIGDLGQFLDGLTAKRKPNEKTVQLLHNFSLTNSQFAKKKYVCFRRALVPGFLKGRFFVSDNEYPSTKPPFQFPADDSPVIPRDSLRIREQVSAVINQKPWFRTTEKELIFIDRRGRRRVFDETRKPDIMKAFEDVAKKHSYRFKVISFENMSFMEQYNAVSSAAIAIGIHGANLVNTMFMPPLSVLIEIFPFGFTHNMYRNGGNAGLKYYSYQMRTGIKFEAPNMYRSPEQCVRLNHTCKLHYRDSVLQVIDDDIREMREILETAVGWCEKSGREKRRLLHDSLHAALRRESQVPSG